jgi:hypothetical protein
VIVEPPSVGSTTDEHGHTRYQKFMIKFTGNWLGFLAYSGGDRTELFEKICLQYCCHYYIPIVFSPVPVTNKLDLLAGRWHSCLTESTVSTLWRGWHPGKYFSISLMPDL